MQPLYSKITHLESITFCGGGLSYGSNRAGIGADRVAPLDMEGGTSESNIAIVSLDQQRVDALSPAKQVGLLSKVFVHFIARGREWLKLT